jgi:hypothetical protein
VEVYEYEMTDQHHHDIIKIVQSMPAMVGISTYENKIYREGLNGWNIYTFKSMTRSGLADEQLWMNYPEPEQLHDYRYLGKDFTDRQRIKRKIEREVNKLRNLPALERNAIIQSVLGTF